MPLKKSTRIVYLISVIGRSTNSSWAFHMCRSNATTAKRNGIYNSKMEHIARTMCKIVQFDIANKWHNNVVYYKIVFLIKRDVVWVLDKDKETKKQRRRRKECFQCDVLVIRLSTAKTFQFDWWITGHICVLEWFLCIR